MVNPNMQSRSLWNMPAIQKETKTLLYSNYDTFREGNGREKLHVHRKLRAGKGFETIECYTDLKKAAEILQTKETGSVLLECMSNLVANEMYDPSGAGENAEESILAGDP